MVSKCKFQYIALIVPDTIQFNLNKNYSALFNSTSFFVLFFLDFQGRSKSAFHNKCRVAWVVELYGARRAVGTKKEWDAGSCPTRKLSDKTQPNDTQLCRRTSVSENFRVGQIPPSERNASEIPHSVYFLRYTWFKLHEGTHATKKIKIKKTAAGDLHFYGLCPPFCLIPTTFGIQTCISYALDPYHIIGNWKECVYASAHTQYTN